MLVSSSGRKPYVTDQKGCRCPIPGNFEGEAGLGSEEPDEPEDVPAYWGWIGLAGLKRFLPTQIIL